MNGEIRGEVEELAAISFKMIFIEFGVEWKAFDVILLSQEENFVQDAWNLSNFIPGERQSIIDSSFPGCKHINC